MLKQSFQTNEISKFSSDAPEENQKDLTSTKMSEKKINTNSRELKIDYHVRSLQKTAHTLSKLPYLTLPKKKRKKEIQKSSQNKPN